MQETIAHRQVSFRLYSVLLLLFLTSNHKLSSPARFTDLLCDRLRCYMRFALDNAITVPNPMKPTKSGEPKEWTKNVEIWRQDLSGRRLNPWHENMDESMFYL